MVETSPSQDPKVRGICTLRDYCVFFFLLFPKVDSGLAEGVLPLDNLDFSSDEIGLSSTPRFQIFLNSLTYRSIRTSTSRNDCD